MLFDERPKTRRQELFDRDIEIEGIKSNVDRPLLVISGIRRIGKTSTLLVALNELGRDYVLIDCRKLKENYGRQDLYNLFSSSFSTVVDKVKGVLSGVRGVSILGNSIEFKWKGRDSVSLADLFDHLNGKRLIIAMDETQKLRGPLSKEVREAIAHAYDYDRNLTFILTGSEVGLLYDFLGVEDRESPLYGRYYYQITLDRFEKERATEFLRKGFDEISAKVSDEETEKLVEFFDGIPGWLTFGANRFLEGRKIEEVREIAIDVALNEIENLIETKRRVSEIVGRRYKNALKCLALGENSWSKLSNCLQRAEGSTMSSSVLENIITNLEKSSIIKDYEFLDPIYGEASKRLS
ncbi:ATP-binding protein [Metallosphaera tengchongensis]|uniref:ATP-binding protein n=1 Tax=Metallosphaera tengchongensis TaxID=1532350 RepID=A0A6N0NVL7_9CREN|nr:ATP-binding protein [Metallosphaera tengchongensis]QKR00876.1 ATP-binding protein [Metallosphaera tengchongensis]